ncbi:MAG: DNA cytosine methyltransferase, partial [Chloroflexi bacterium]|nr:DNA cytosine methyltransferase [Chloroflexota bacterium]
NIDFIFGNPPCAPWSMAAVQPVRNRDYEHKDKYRHDPRVSCVYNLFQLLTELQPDVWVWESVQGAFKRGRDLVDELTQAAPKLGYSATYVLFNGLDIGTPQHRRRFFCVFHKHAIPWDHPLGKQHWNTVRDVIGSMPTADPEDVPPLGQFEKLIKYTRPKEGFRGAWERIQRKKLGDEENWPRNAQGHFKGRPAFIQHRLGWDQIPPTHIGGCHQAHPEDDRWISWREASALGGYSPDYVFDTDLLNKYVIMFQAVLPAAGEWLARNVARGLTERREVRGEVWIRDFEKNAHQRLR